MVYMNSDNNTYILAYYHIPENKKNNLQHYHTHMPKTFDMLTNKNIVFFYEDENILEYVKSIVKTTHSQFIPILLKLTDLPTYELSKHLLESCKNQDNEYLKSMNDHKGIVHYNREYLQSGEDSYRKVISIWTSKILLMEKVILKNPFQSNTFAWVDVSISRINMDIRMVSHKVNKINTNQCWALYMGERILHSGGIMISDTNTWKTLIELYKRKLEEIKDANYAHDEETIIHLIYKENPHLFCIL